MARREFEDAVEDQNLGKAYSLCEELEGENCECLAPEYVLQLNGVCSSLGDCGAYANIANKATVDGIEFKVNEEKQTTIIEGILGSVRERSK